MSIYDLKNDRKALLDELARLKNTITVPPEIIDPDYQNAFRWARALDQYLVFYFNDETRTVPAEAELHQGIDQILNNCFDE